MAALVLLPAMLLAAPAVWAGEIHYDITIAGRPVGQQVVTRKSFGSVHVESCYRDNGRGPDIREDWLEDDSGLPVDYHRQGTSTFGGGISDRFRAGDGQAQWQSLAEQGKQALTAPAACLPVEGSTACLGTLVAAALRRGGTLALLPGGSLQLERPATQEVGSPGTARTVTLYALHGLDIEPWYLRMNPGPDPRKPSATATTRCSTPTSGCSIST